MQKNAPRGNLAEDENPCAAFRATLALKRLSPRWTAPILTVLAGGPQRFNALQRALPPISAKVLNERLVAMEADGLVIRTEVVSEPPKTVIYALAADGQRVQAALSALACWHDRLDDSSRR